ncbi:MAG: molybdopterin-dependent oxidoreductase [bacterium]|nr:molybdopterin-dependent oxidoreductase [bacterium]
MCGLRFDVAGDRIVRVAGDPDDPCSRGWVCPKGLAIADVHHDPDRLRTPLRRTKSGDFEPIGWDAALDLVAERLLAVKRAHGGDAVGVYIGNPVVHNHGALLLRAALLRALGTRNAYSASSQDTAPRFAASYYLYGASLVVPVPDVDRTQYLLCIGANPVVSNGSFVSAPNFKERLHALRRRGGRLVVVDPRRSETARIADEHVPIRPGTDAALLLAMVQVLAARGRVDAAAIARAADGWEAVVARLGAFAPERVAGFTGVPAATIERLALEFADAPSGSAYSRIGTCNAHHGTLSQWATDLLNLAGGRLGAIGGAIFPEPVVDTARLGRFLGDGHGRWRSRVRGLPETLGDLPGATLADEIETPGDGQIRALLTYAGNPVLSLPNGRRVEAAIRQLDFVACIDLYVNETTRHADVILPPAWALAEDHVDVLVASFAVRTVARWSPPVVARGADERADWEILLALALRLGGGPMGMRALDAAYRLGARVGLRWHPTSTTGLVLRLGPHGDRFLPWSRGLTMRRLRAAPHGLDLGPPRAGVAHRVFHRSGRMQLAAPPILHGLGVLETDVARPAGDMLRLIGRRDLRSNNSWMHNVPAMVSGRDRCVLLVHPDDARRAGVADGTDAVLESRVHAGTVRVRVSDEMLPGVVSLPHGWGHAASARWQRVAGAHPGVSANDWTDDAEVEAIVGQSVLNGVPVRLRAATA